MSEFEKNSVFIDESESLTEKTSGKFGGIFSKIEKLEKKFKLSLALASFLTILSMKNANASEASPKKEDLIRPQEISDSFKVPKGLVYRSLFYIEKIDGKQMNDKSHESVGDLLTLENKTLIANDVFYNNIFYGHDVTDDKNKVSDSDEVRAQLSISILENKIVEFDKVFNVKGIGSNTEGAIAEAISNALSSNKIEIKKYSHDSVSIKSDVEEENFQETILTKSSAVIKFKINKIDNDKDGNFVAYVTVNVCNNTQN